MPRCAFGVGMPCTRVISCSHTNQREGKVKHIACAVFVVLSLTGRGWAQTAGTGTVIGTVTDPSSAVVPGAKIELRDLTTGIVRSVVTNGAGQYSFVGVQPGSYSVKGMHPGFLE